MENNLQPIGLIKTMPQSWLNALPEGLAEWEKDFLSMNNSENKYWLFNLSGKPKYDVLYFYLLFGGFIRYKANIIGYSDSMSIECYDGSVHNGKVWVQVAAPVIKLDRPITMKGFQVFRYCYEDYK